MRLFQRQPATRGLGIVFVVTVIAGGAIAAFTGGEFANEWLPPMWIARFGDSITPVSYTHLTLPTIYSV